VIEKRQINSFLFQVSVMFGYDTTPNFVAGVAVAQIANFAVCAW